MAWENVTQQQCTTGYPRKWLGLAAILTPFLIPAAAQYLPFLGFGKMKIATYGVITLAAIITAGYIYMYDQPEYESSCRLLPFRVQQALP